MSAAAAYCVDLVRRWRAGEKLASNVAVLFIDKYLPPASPTEERLGFNRSMAAVHPVRAQKRADDVCLALAANHCETHDIERSRSFTDSRSVRHRARHVRARSTYAFGEHVAPGNRQISWRLVGADGLDGDALLVE